MWREQAWGLLRIEKLKLLKTLGFFFWFSYNTLFGWVNNTLLIAKRLLVFVSSLLWLLQIRYKCCRLRLAHTSLLTLLFLLTICFAVTLVLIVLMVVFVSITSQQSSASSSVVFTVGEQPSYEAIDWLHDPVIEEINHKRFNHTLLWRHWENCDKINCSTVPEVQNIRVVRSQTIRKNYPFFKKNFFFVETVEVLIVNM